MSDAARTGRWKFGTWLLPLSIFQTFPLSSQSRFWRPEDRVLVSDYSVVDAVAASPWVVYAATRHGLLLYDRRTSSWQLPVTAQDGYPAARVRVALADPAGNAVWLGTTDGWARYDADLRRWEVGPAPGGVSDLLLDESDAIGGVFLRDATGWSYLARGALVAVPDRPLPPPARRVQPLDVSGAVALAPMVAAQRALILTDSRLRSFQFTTAARSADANDLYLGTNGLGLVHLDPAMAQWELLRFGLLAPGADALAPGADGVWAASASRLGSRSGVTWLPQDLGSSIQIEPPASSGWGVAAVRRALTAAGTLWIATDAGVVRLEPSSGQTRRFTTSDGLPSDDVRALAPAPDGIWIGTARGLAVITAGGSVVPVGASRSAVLSLLAVRETLWVGTTTGLGVLSPGATEPVIAGGVAATPELHGAIVGLARAGDTVVAALEDQAAWRDPRTDRWTLQRLRALGRISAIAGDAGGVWVAGSIALVWWRIAGGEQRALTVPGDLPAPVRDVAVAAPWVWIATDSGVVRLRRETVTGSR